MNDEGIVKSLQGSLICGLYNNNSK